MKNNKLILILTLFFLIIIFIITFSKSKNLFSQVKEVEREVNILQQRADNIIVFKKSQAVLEQKIQEIESRFIDLKAPISFIEFLEKTAQDNDLILKITPQTIIKEEKDQWKSLRLQVNLKGDFFNFMNFLQETEKAPYFLDILNIVVYREKDLLQEVEVSLLIKIFGK